MKMAISALALAAVTTIPGWSAAMAQEARMGVSHPDEAVIAATPDETAAPVKPSAAIAVTPKSTTASAGETYGAYVPYAGPKVASSADAGQPLTEAQADATIVTTEVDRPGRAAGGDAAAGAVDTGAVNGVNGRGNALCSAADGAGRKGWAGGDAGGIDD